MKIKAVAASSLPRGFRFRHFGSESRKAAAADLAARKFPHLKGDMLADKVMDLMVNKAAADFKAVTVDLGNGWLEVTAKNAGLKAGEVIEVADNAMDLLGGRLFSARFDVVEAPVGPTVDLVTESGKTVTLEIADITADPDADLIEILVGLPHDEEHYTAAGRPKVQAVKAALVAAGKPSDIKADDIDRAMAKLEDAEGLPEDED